MYTEKQFEKIKKDGIYNIAKKLSQRVFPFSPIVYQSEIIKTKIFASEAYCHLFTELSRVNDYEEFYALCYEISTTDGLGLIMTSAKNQELTRLIKEDNDNEISSGKALQMLEDNRKKVVLVKKMK